MLEKWGRKRWLKKRAFLRRSSLPLSLWLPFQSQIRGNSPALHVNKRRRNYSDGIKMISLWSHYSNGFRIENGNLPNVDVYILSWSNSQHHMGTHDVFWRRQHFIPNIICVCELPFYFKRGSPTQGGSRLIAGSKCRAKVAIFNTQHCIKIGYVGMNEKDPSALHLSEEHTEFFLSSSVFENSQAASVAQIF